MSLYPTFRCTSTSAPENRGTFLRARQAFRNPETAQAYLNLLVLWHNMRSFQRGKRAGHSPFQWANITPGTDDWLTLLGYPAA